MLTDEMKRVLFFRILLEFQTYFFYSRIVYLQMRNESKKVSKKSVAAAFLEMLRTLPIPMRLPAVDDDMVDDDDPLVNFSITL